MQLPYIGVSCLSPSLLMKFIKFGAPLIAVSAVAVEGTPVGTRVVYDTMPGGLWRVPTAPRPEAASIGGRVDGEAEKEWRVTGRIEELTELADRGYSWDELDNSIRGYYGSEPEKIDRVVAMTSGFLKHLSLDELNLLAKFDPDYFLLGMTPESPAFHIYIAMILPRFPVPDSSKQENFFMYVEQVERMQLIFDSRADLCVYGESERACMLIVELLARSNVAIAAFIRSYFNYITAPIPMYSLVRRILFPIGGTPEPQHQINEREFNNRFRRVALLRWGHLRTDVHTASLMSRPSGPDEIPSPLEHVRRILKTLLWSPPPLLLESEKVFDEERQRQDERLRVLDRERRKQAALDAEARERKLIAGAGASSHP